MKQLEPTLENIAKVAPAFGIDVEPLSQEIRSGKAWLLQALSAPLTFAVKPSGKTLIVTAAAGKNLSEASAEIIDYAAQQGFKTIGWYTSVPERLKKGLAGYPVRWSVAANGQHYCEYDIMRARRKTPKMLKKLKRRNDNRKAQGKEPIRYIVQNRWAGPAVR